MNRSVDLGQPEARQIIRYLVIGIIIGTVAGIVAGATLIAPRLAEPDGEPTIKPASVASLGLPAAPADRKLPGPAPDPGNSIRWKMASAFSGSLPQLGELAKRLEANVDRISGGAFAVEFHEPAALVPALEMFDAVRTGVVDAAFSSPTLWGDKLPALQLFTAIPFGPTAEEYLAWVYYGGGREIYEELYHANGIHPLVCGTVARAGAGWFRKPVRSVDDLKGLRMNAFGLGAKVLAEIGVETMGLAEGEIFVAFEKGVVDAVEFSQPAADLGLELQSLAKYYYFPSWHQASALFELIVNLDAWRALPDKLKVQLETACGDNVRHGLAHGEALQFAAVKRMTALGVALERWPQDVLEALRAAWGRVAAEQIAADRDFKRAWVSLERFREDYAIWRELSEP